MSTNDQTGPSGPNPQTTAPVRARRRPAAASAALAIGLVLAAMAGLTAPIPGPGSVPSTTTTAPAPEAVPAPAPPGDGPSAEVDEAAGPLVVDFDGEAGGLTGVSTSANATVSSAAAKYGNGGLRLASTETAGYARWGTDVVPAGQTHATTQQWVRVLSRGAGQTVDVVTVGNAQQSANFDLFMSGVTQRFQWDLYRDDTDQSDFVVELGRWYLIEARVEFSGTQHTAEVRIDGVLQGPPIASAGTSTTVRMLTVGTTVAKTHSQDYDDIELQVGSSPLGWLADTPPSASIARPVHRATYDRGQTVTADFACAGGDHAVVSCVGSVADGVAIDTSSLGERSFTVTATDRAGYTASRTHTYTVVDGTDPTVSITSPAAAATYARGTAVVADYACADEAGGSGLAPSGGCVGTVADGASIDTSTLGAKSFTVTATDRAGNTRTVTRTYTVTDVGEPTVELASPVDGTTYTRGASVQAAFTCADDPGGSGVPADGCVGSVPAGAAVDTMALGDHDFSVTATDNAGNTTTVTGTYSVVRNRPDAHIRRAGAIHFAGDGVYSPNGAGQTHVTHVGPRGEAVFFIRVENDGVVANDFRVRGPRSDVRWTVRYLDGTRNVTRSVTAGTFAVEDLAPGGTRVLRVAVRPTTRADRGNRRDVTVTMSAATQPGVGDTVRAVIRRA